MNNKPHDYLKLNHIIKCFILKKKSSDHNYNIYKDELKYSSQNVK